LICDLPQLIDPFVDEESEVKVHIDVSWAYLQGPPILFLSPSRVALGHEKDAKVIMGVNIRWVELESQPVRVLGPSQVALAVKDNTEVEVHIDSFRTDFKDIPKAGLCSTNVTGHHELICDLPQLIDPFVVFFFLFAFLNNLSEDGEERYLF